MKLSIFTGVVFVLSTQFAIAGEAGIPEFPTLAEARLADCGGYFNGTLKTAADNITTVKILGETPAMYELETPITACQMGKFAKDQGVEVWGFGTQGEGAVTTIDGYNPAPN